MSRLEKKDILFEAIKRASLQNVRYKNVRSDGSFDPTVIHNLYVKPNMKGTFHSRLMRMLDFTSCYHNGQNDLFHEFNTRLDQWGLSDTVKDKYICNMFRVKNLTLRAFEPMGDYKYVSVRGKIHLKGVCYIEGEYTLEDPAPYSNYNIENKVEDMLLENKGYAPVNNPNISNLHSPIPDYPSLREIERFSEAFIGKPFLFGAQMDILVDISKDRKLKEDYQRFLKKEGFYGLK